MKKKRRKKKSTLLQFYILLLLTQVYDLNTMLFLFQIMLILVVIVEVYLVLSLIQTYFYDDLQPNNILVEQMYKDDVIYDKYFPIFFFS